MNDILLSVLATFSTVLLGVIARGILVINNKQSSQGIEIEKLAGKVDGVIKITNSLHSWRDSLQKDQIREYQEIIRQLKEGKDV